MKKLEKWRCMSLSIQKIVRVMKISVFLVLVCTLQLSASVMLGQQVSLKTGEMSVREVFKELKAQTGSFFMYSEKEISQDLNVDIEISNVSLEDALELICEQALLQYEIVDDYVLITKSPIVIKTKIKQEKKGLEGKVIDETGVPLPGVSIVVKGSSIGVSTDMNGRYKLNLKLDKVVLVYSFIGMVSQEVKYTGQNEIDIVLKYDSEALGEVVVTGYQEIKKTRMTGAVVTVTAADIVNKGITSVEDALKGQLVGVSSMNTSGRPGSSAQIRIRGINSLTGNTSPIWILDGMPLQGDLPSVADGTSFESSVLTNGIGNISPDDIESITILKDAAATAIYGSRAANGVIVVKTKQGTAGKSYINVRSTFSIEEAPHSRLSMMDSNDKINFERSLHNDFPHVTIDGRVFKLLKDVDRGVVSRADAEKAIETLRGVNTNWYDEIFRTGTSQNHSVSMSGGSEKTQFYSSVNYLSQKGIMPNNKYNNFGANLRITHDFTDKLRINFKLSSSVRNDRSSASIINPLRYATFANPYEKPYNEDGSFAYDRTFKSDLSQIRDGYKYDVNVLEDLNANTSETRYVSNTMNLKLEYKLLDGLTFVSQSSISATSSHARREMLPGTYSSKASAWLNNVYAEKEIPDYMNKGSLRESTTRSDSYTFRNHLEYAKSFKDIHFFNMILGQEISSKESNRFANYSPEYAPQYGLIGYPNLKGIDAGDLSMDNLGKTSEYQNRSASFFATMSYTYDDKYVISGSFRKDGVDIIGTDNRFTPLWNISGKWNIYKETFMEDVNFVDVLSVRASYGFTGSIDHSAYPFTTLKYTSSSFRYNGELVPTYITPGNPSIKWQKKEDRSIGVDFSLFRRRINGTINYYNNDTRDVLDYLKTASSTGRNSVRANVASLRNSGYEFSLSTVNIDSKNFRWTTSFNISLNNNKVTDTYYKSIADLPVSSKNYRIGSLFVKNKPVNAWYGYEFAGVDQATGHPLAYIDARDDKGNALGHKRADGRYVIDMDSEFSNKALKYLGEGYPPITGGFGTMLTYKRLSFSTQFTFMTGHKIKSFRPGVGSPLSSAKLNLLEREQNRWRKVGDVTNVPVYSSNYYSAYTKYFFDSEIEDGSFLKCSYASLSYNLAQKICDKLAISRLKINFNAHNLFTFTKYKGIDPETMGAFGYPSARKYMIGINVGF